MNRICILASITLATMAAADGVIPQTDRNGRYKLDTIWLEAGMGPAVTDGDIKGVSLNGTAFNLGVGSEWSPGMHAGIEWSRSKLQLDGEGMTFGVAVWYDRARGRVNAATTQNGPATIDERLDVEILSLALLPAWTWRFDSDTLEHVVTREWQVDVGPVVAVGAARASIGGGEQSSPGFTWQAGGRIRLHAQISEHTRAGLYAGATWLDATTEWNNSTPSEFLGFSPIAGLILGYEL